MRPTASQKASTLDRDRSLCAACGALDALEFQHRAAVGMGGSKIPPLAAEGLTLCSRCNAAVEAHRQTEALWHGWKVRRWVPRQKGAHMVPVFYVPEMSWWRLTVTGERVELSPAVVARFMEDVYGAEWAEWGAQLFAERPVQREVYGSWRS